jgi:hypothetical protein
MTRITSLTTSVVVAVVLLAASAVPVHAQGALTNKRTFLTFSGPVEVPGATLPAGRYIFQITNIASQTVWQVLDANTRRLITQFFYVETRDRTTQEQNAADNRPIVRFHEAPEGMPPAVSVMYYPSDARGYMLVYPTVQAERIAAAAHQPVPATDTDALAGGIPAIVTIRPETARANGSVSIGSGSGRR